MCVRSTLNTAGIEMVVGSISPVQGLQGATAHSMCGLFGKRVLAGDREMSCYYNEGMAHF